VPAFLAHTNKVVFLNDGDVVVIEDGKYSITDLEGQPLERPVDTISWSPAMAEKAGYTHFMQKEIFEQPRALDRHHDRAGQVGLAGCVPARSQP
jgi:glucosamine--fructose-6-phosphate aminotransferase (isomerizing)